MTGFVLIPKDVATDIRVMLASIAQPDFLRAAHTPERQLKAEKLYRELLTARSVPRDNPEPRSANDMELRKALKDLADFVKHGNNAEGHCMCGSPMENHGYYNEHTAVDMGDYHADLLVKRAEAVLGGEIGND